MLWLWLVKLCFVWYVLRLVSVTTGQCRTVDQVHKQCTEFHFLYNSGGVAMYCSNSLYSFDYNAAHKMLSSGLIQLASIHCPFHLCSRKERQTTLVHCGAVLFVVRISDSALNVFSRSNNSKQMRSYIWEQKEMTRENSDANSQKVRVLSTSSTRWTNKHTPSPAILLLLL